ncbi:Isoleucine--tRNA ligase [Frankliniella fusca]|uniref:Isoleucine--tRNA ligase n=1 Tax=Frankliniella fusca TaxID=407009 RepID=A0AAE1GQZ4_9NEOP|nr:Isoleucine--tRNA ligase [Frankliniella fusca]
MHQEQILENAWQIEGIGKLMCERLILREERQDIFDTFWALEDIEKKCDFISRSIDEHIPSSCCTSPDCAKKSIRIHHFVIDGEEIRVCKAMFINTLSIPDVWIETTLKKITPTGLMGDNRGKHDNRLKRIPDATLQSVRDHINLFPKVQSHYTRERTKREYLETHVFSVERMHKLYLEWEQENKIEKPASISAYRNFLNTEFNLGLF